MFIVNLVAIRRGTRASCMFLWNLTVSGADIGVSMTSCHIDDIDLQAMVWRSNCRMPAVVLTCLNDRDMIASTEVLAMT